MVSKGPEETRIYVMDKDLSSIQGIVTKIQLVRDGNYLVTLENGQPSPTIAEILKLNLQHPESYMIFKEGDEINVIGNCTDMDDYIKVRRFEIIQPEKLFTKTLSTSISKDSVKVENLVTFSSYEDDHVIFTLRITNLGSRLIPALNPHNNSFLISREPYVHLTEFYKNDILGGLGIYNGTAYPRSTINRGGVSETSEGSTLTKDSGIRMNGDTITIQWKYMGILSEKVTVDLKNQKVIK
jgi:hypothetical protein